MKLLTIASLALMAFATEAPGGHHFSRTAMQEHAGRTTKAARRLALSRIEEIARMGNCKQDFVRQNIDLDQLRRTMNTVRFYSAIGSEGELRFSQTVGRPAAPDETLRALALRLPADAFVLGYLDGRRYVRTKHVVLNRGYFEHDEDGRQSLLLHELLHIVLDTDDDDLNERDLCPLRLLSFCPRGRMPE